MSGSPIPVGKFFTLGSGLKVHYHEAGDRAPGRPTILCIHGGGPGASGYSNFKKNMPAFAQQGYHVLAPDLLGFGLSDKPDDIDYSSVLHVEAMRELTTGLGVDRVVPIGNSLGGSVALEYTLEHPAAVDRLVLMAPGGVENPALFWGQTDGGRALADFARTDDGSEESFRKVLTLLVHDEADITDTAVAERYEIARSQPKRVFTSVTIRETWTRLGEIDCPVLVFWGANDRFLPVDQALKAAREIRDAKIVVSSQAGHWYMLEQPDDFNREVLDFLARPARA
ncbi:alpha/beta fold hydrolase [Sphingosinicella terrae]|uniref:alpha/beta fold hydrolase n=1 Tax=Sphingosinicella terrae TaxID=2172047 RepID=UPI000E0CE17A|nr:alpha/beta hydrolase [Sphingosinicella terrae]